MTGGNGKASMGGREREEKNGCEWVSDPQSYASLLCHCHALEKRLISPSQDFCLT